MTVTTTQIRISYTGDGVSVNFTVPWLFYANTDLLVYLAGSIANPGIYSITGAGLGSGTLTMATPPAVGANLQIILNVPLTQTANLVDGTAFPSATVNQMVDRAVQAELRLQDQLSRSVRAPDGDVLAWPVMAAAAARAGKALMFDPITALPTLGVPNTQTLTTGLLAPFLGLAPTPAEAAAIVTPVNLQYLPHEARREGATANAVTDDSTAIGNATKIAQVGLYDIPMVSWLVGGGYKIANTITTSYAGQGQVNFKGAKIHGPTVIYPTMATYVFEFDADAFGQQEVKFKLEDMMVQGDGTHFPSFMRTSYIYFAEANSINSFGSGPVIDWQYGGQNRSRNCTAFNSPGQVGFNIYRSHDAYVTEFHAYGNATGVQAIGLNSASQDGNMNFANGISHGNTAFGFYLKGLYVANLFNIVAEVQPVNVHQENCQYGILWGAFLGPTNAAPNYSLHYAWTSGLGNTFNIVGAFNAQNEMQYESLQSTVIADGIIASATSSITGAAISLRTSALNLISGLLVRNPAITYSYIQDATSNTNIINGGRYEQQIYLQGTKAARSGNIIMPNFAPSIKTDDAVQGQFALTEYVRYFDGTRVNETSFGGVGGNYLLPYLAQTGTIVISGTATFDVTTLVPAGAASLNGYEAEFLVFGGPAGSSSGAKVLVLRSLDGTVLTLLSTIGNRGTLSVTVAGSIITANNNSVSVTCPYSIKMTKLVGY
jgi:hypothetical protein